MSIVGKRKNGSIRQWLVVDYPLITNFFEAPMLHKKLKWLILFRAVAICHAVYLCGMGASLVAQNRPAASSDQPADDRGSFVTNIMFEIEFERMSQAPFFQHMAQDGRFPTPFSDMPYLPKTVHGVLALPKDLTLLVERWAAMSDQGPFSLNPAVHFYVEQAFSPSPGYSRFKEQVERAPGEEVDGVRQISLAPEQSSPVAVLEDRRVVAFSSLYSLLPKGLPEATKEADQLFRQAPRSDFIMAVDMESLRKMISEGIAQAEGALPSELVDDLRALESVEGLTLFANFDDQLSLGLDLECRNATDVQRVFTIAQKYIDEFKSSPEAMPQFPLPGGVETSAELVKSLRARSTGRRVEIRGAIGKAFIKGVQNSAQEVRVLNNQRQMLIAMHNFHDVYGRLPFLDNPDQHESLSWRVSLLPLINQGDLHAEFDLSQPWDSPHNRALLDKMPELFGRDGMTNMCWVKSDVNVLNDITNGTANTICFIAGSKRVPWTQNNDLTHVEAMAMFMALEPGEQLLVTMYDGSVRRIPAETDLDTFEKMLIPRD